MSTIKERKATSFYRKLLRLLKEKDLPFMVGGTYAFSAYTGISRPTKDMDVFATPHVFPSILRAADEVGYATELFDEHWIAKIHKEHYTTDVIFAEKNGLNKVDDKWFSRSRVVPVLGVDVRLIPLEEMIKSKAFIQNRNRYDGPDVIHLILKQGRFINWKLLLEIMDPHWEVILAHLVNFMFVYPADKSIIPSWVMEKLLAELHGLLSQKEGAEKVTRGLLYSMQYKVSIEKWGYRDISRAKIGFEET